jgi:hypothetical protein
MVRPAMMGCKIPLRARVTSIALPRAVTVCKIRGRNAMMLQAMPTLRMPVAAIVATPVVGMASSIRMRGVTTTTPRLATVAMARVRSKL